MVSLQDGSKEHAYLVLPVAVVYGLASVSMPSDIAADGFVVCLMSQEKPLGTVVLYKSVLAALQGSFNQNKVRQTVLNAVMPA